MGSFHKLMLHIAIILFVIFESNLIFANQAKLVVNKHPNYHVYEKNSNEILKLSDFKELLLAVNGFTIKNVNIY
jgi:hypothetical protein